MAARDAICDALQRFSPMLNAAGTCFVGFSGGLDSTVLLHALTSGCSRAALPADRVRALHANHGLHGEARRAEVFCQAHCESFGVALASTTLELKVGGKGVEAAAREARYRWFEGQLAPGDCLLLAHHQDDQAETLLLRLLRGAGPDGLAAMPEQRSLGAGVLLRPLLSLPRSLLQDYAREQGLRWVTDPSNADPGFDRNFLRREIMPRLETRWPGYRKTFVRTAGQMRDLLPLLSPETTLPLDVSVAGDPGFPLESLPQDPLRAALALRGWLRERGLEMPPAARLQEFLRQLADAGGAQLATPEWVLQRFRRGVYLHPALRPGLPESRGIKPGETIADPALGVVTLRAAPEALEDGQTLRLAFRRGGERLLAADGRHRDLKTVFQTHALPPWWRDRTPLLMLCQDGRCELIAVGSCARSPRAVALDVGLEWEPPTLAVK